jgi:hypothetical protein
MAPELLHVLVQNALRIDRVVDKVGDSVGILVGLADPMAAPRLAVPTLRLCHSAEVLDGQRHIVCYTALLYPRGVLRLEQV